MIKVFVMISFAFRGTVRKMWIYNTKPIFPTIPPFSTTLRKFYMKESFVLLTKNGRLHSYLCDAYFLDVIKGRTVAS